jgi:opacity protein-like surface antigen
MRIITLILSAVMLGAAPLYAGTPSPVPEVSNVPEQASDWSFRLALYGWAQSLDGDVTARGISSPVDVGFDDILDNLDFGAMGAVEIGYGRWSFLVDGVYAKISASAPTPFGFVADSLDMQFKQFLGHAVVSYEFTRTDKVKFDAYFGARINWLDLELELGAFNQSDEKTWIDPIVGVRLQAELGHSFFFRTLADVGGFGISSDFTWQAMAGFGYHFNDNCSALLTYRAIGTDYTNGGFTYDVTAHGPVIGLEYRF